MRCRFLILLLSSLLCSLIVVGGLPKTADACGAFAGPRGPTDNELAKELPFLTVEQVVLVWDKDTGTEDFIRETRFSQANKAFGFVVPTPTKPEVAAVKKAPFDALRKAYSYDDPHNGLGGLGGGAKGSGAGGGGGAEEPPVVVLSEQRIGSFTAFTLSATDAKALEKWLADNNLAMTEQAKPWLAHYVALKFFFVAFRYEPKPAATDGPPSSEMTSETVRIRFNTPLPYYPYMEPAHPVQATGGKEARKRMLSGWLVTRSLMDPVAFHAKASVTAPGIDYRGWQRPWTLGRSFQATPAELTDALALAEDSDLRAVIPKSDKAPLYVQTFRDLKPSRVGFGDALFVQRTVPDEKPQTEAEIAAENDARKILLPVIDPTLIDEDPATLAPPKKKARACSVGDAVGGGGAASASISIAMLGLGALLFLRRSRARVVLSLVGLVACHRETTHENERGDASSSPRVGVFDPGLPMPSREEREKTALKILRAESPPRIDESVQPVMSAALKKPGPKAEVAFVDSVEVVKGPAIMGVDRVMAGLFPRLRACYQTGLTIDSAMSGKLTLQVRVNPNGEVDAAEAKDVAGLSPAVARCSEGVVKRAQFTAPGLGGSTFVVKLVFTSKMAPL